MKAAIYCRYSSDNQREESIEAQSRAIKEYCQRKGIQIVKTYADEARSATTDNRPQFLEMIKDSAIRNYLEKDSDIKNKSLDDQKRIIKTFVSKVTVYDSDIDINTIVTFMSGGGGSRTHVQKHFTKSFYECICYFRNSLQRTPNRRLSYQLSPIILLEVGKSPQVVACFK